MADLTITPAAGSQGATQSPQAVPSGQAISGASAQSGSVQPGTATSVLTSQNGLSLHATALTSVSLDKTASTGSQARPALAAQPAHHTNPALFMISIALVLIAAALFLAINRSAKNTTD